MKRVLNLFLAVLLVCTVNGLGDMQAQSNNKVAQLEKLSAIENNSQKTIRKRTAAIRHSLKTAASAESVKLFGCMTYSSKWSTSENGEFGIYSFPAEEGTAFTPVKTAADFNLSAAVYADRKFCGYRVTTYGSTVSGVYYYLFDTDGWTRDIQQTLKASYDNYPISLAYDSKTKTIYGQFMSEAGTTRLCTVDGVQGMNHYNVIVYDEQGRGRDAEKSVFIGTDIPQHVQNLIASWDDENDQAALLTWNAPAETGANGGFINPEELTYNYGTYLFGSIIDMATGIKETSYLMTTAGLTKQTYTQGYICAVSAGGKGAYTPFGIMLGTPLAFPFAESFTQGNVSTETWSVATVGGDDAWGMYQNGGSLDAQDEDNGYAMLVNKKAEADDSRLESPIINIAGQDKLTLEFYLYTEDAELTVETTVNGTIYEAVSEALQSDGSNEWTKVSLPLDQLAGNKRIQLGFRGKTEKAGARIAIDNITLTSGSTGIADETADNSSIYSEGRNIILTGLNGVQVTVYSLDGKTITNASLHTDYEVIPMQHAGCYLVHTEKGVTKVLVK